MSELFQAVERYLRDKNIPELALGKVQGVRLGSVSIKFDGSSNFITAPIPKGVQVSLGDKVIVARPPRTSNWVILGSYSEQSGATSVSADSELSSFVTMYQLLNKFAAPPIIGETTPNSSFFTSVTTDDLTIPGGSVNDILTNDGDGGVVWSTAPDFGSVLTLDDIKDTVRKYEFIFDKDTTYPFELFTAAERVNVHSIALNIIRGVTGGATFSIGAPSENDCLVLASDVDWQSKGSFLSDVYTVHDPKTFYVYKSGSITSGYVKGTIVYNIDAPTVTDPGPATLTYPLFVDGAIGDGWTIVSGELGASNGEDTTLRAYGNIVAKFELPDRQEFTTDAIQVYTAFGGYPDQAISFTPWLNQSRGYNVDFPGSGLPTSAVSYGAATVTRSSVIGGWTRRLEYSASPSPVTVKGAYIAMNPYLVNITSGLPEDPTEYLAFMSGTQITITL